MRRSDNHKFSNLGHWHHGGIGRIAPAPDGGRGRALLKAVLATGVAAAMLHATHAGGVPADPLRMADLTPVTVHPAPQHAPVALARDGRPVAVVYVAEPAPSAALQRMLDELITVVRLTTGATLERVAEPPSDEQPALILGDSQASRLAGIAADAIPVEGFVVKTAPNRIFLVGSTRALPAMDPRSLGGTPYANDGTAWAVADFLERFVGVRWYWPIDTGGRSIIAQPSLAVPPVHYEDRPVFRRRDFFPRHGYRENDWRALWWDRTSPSLPASLLPPDTELLSMQPLLTALRSGNSWPYLIKVHEPQHFRRQADRYTNRPELFQKNADGSPDLRMLCYSSQAAFDYIVAGCERAWDHGEPVSWVTATCVTVSPGDYVVRCHCPDCLALFEPGRAPYGTASRVMSRFVKRLCEEVAQRWPGRKVIYLPYWNYTECVDDIAFPGNLEIEMCTMAFGLMRQPGPRARMEKHLRAWSEKVGGRITTWEYSHRLHEWTYAPVQYPHLIRDYYQANRDILAGSFLNGGKIGEWSTGAPGNYVWFKVLWNPDLDVDAVLDEWCRRLFGAAGGTCRELLRLMCERWQEAPWSTGLGDNGRVTAPILADTYPPAVVARMVALRDRARREMAGDALVEKRFAYWTWTFDPFLVEVKQAWKEVGIPEAPPLPAAGGAAPARSYLDRVFASIGAMEQDLGTITAAAEQAAERYVAHPEGTLGVMGDGSFFREAADRSGGIMRVYGGAHATGEKGIILFCLSEGDWEQNIRQAKYFAGTGAMIVVFGRQALLDRARDAGCPMAAAIDLHVPGDGTWEDGRIPIDSPVKLAALWLWTGEFVAACTRRGKMPPMYLGYAVPGGKERAAKYGRHTRFHDEAPVAVPAGQVARAYLAALRADLRAVADQEMDAIVRTASLAWETRQAGRGVYAFLHGHAVHSSLGGPADPGYFTQANRDWLELRDDIALQSGDFMLCLGFDQPFDDEWFGNLAPRLRRDGVKLAISVTDYKQEAVRAIPPEEPFINQHWGFGDAVVALPGYDVKILPTSGVIAETILWMVQAGIQARGAAPKAGPVAGTEAGEEAVLAWRFDRDPADLGWSASAGWTPPEGDVPGHVHVRDGEWACDGVPVNPGGVYMAHVTCRADGPGYWQWEFLDAAGRVLFGPVSPITPSDDWQVLSTPVPAHPCATTGVLRIWPGDRKLVRVRELRVEPVTAGEALAVYDTFNATLPELGPCDQPQPGRLIPDAIRRLREGGTLRIVLLGDSFANDLFYGGFGLLLQRAFPAPRIVLIPVVANSAGAYYWRAENRVADRVLPLQPDLVIFTSVSTSVYTMENVADMVRQLRDAGIDEILLTHDAPGNAMEPEHAGKRGWSPRIGPESKDYAGRLYRYALEAGVELADVAGPLLQAILDSGDGSGAYMRDIIHYNDRGRHLMARALVNYFAAAAATAGHEPLSQRTEQALCEGGKE